MEIPTVQWSERLPPRSNENLHDIHYIYLVGGLLPCWSIWNRGVTKTVSTCGSCRRKFQAWTNCSPRNENLALDWNCSVPVTQYTIKVMFINHCVGRKKTYFTFRWTEKCHWNLIFGARVIKYLFKLFKNNNDFFCINYYIKKNIVVYFILNKFGFLTTLWWVMTVAQVIIFTRNSFIYLISQLHNS